MVQGPIPDARRRGVATEEVRRHNLAAVLGGLHLGGPMTRSQLADQTGLNRSTIGDLIGQLTAFRLVVESPGRPRSGPGRPSSVARVSPEGAVVLAVELEVDSLAVATVGLGGHIFDEVRQPNTPANSHPAGVTERLAEMASPLIDGLPATNTLVGVGVGVAGVVRRSDGFVHVSPNLGWSDVPIAEMISSALEVDLVRVANEADVGALGEFRRGAGRNARDMIFVAGEVGVGIGIIHEGTPMLGMAGYAGEAGHATVNPRGRRCRCGSVGCWETEVGEEALLSRVGLRSKSRKAALEEVVSKVGEGDRKALAAVQVVGRWLGVGIGNLINILNPEMVVVGGFFHALYPAMAEAIEEGARDVALEAPWSNCEIVPSQLADEAVLLGAAELVLGEVVSDPAAHLVGPMS